MVRARGLPRMNSIGPNGLKTRFFCSGLCNCQCKLINLGPKIKWRRYLRETPYRLLFQGKVVLGLAKLLREHSQGLVFIVYFVSVRSCSNRAFLYKTCVGSRRREDGKAVSAHRPPAPEVDPPDACKQ